MGCGWRSFVSILWVVLSSVGREAVLSGRSACSLTVYDGCYFRTHPARLCLKQTLWSTRDLIACRVELTCHVWMKWLESLEIAALEWWKALEFLDRLILIVVVINCCWLWETPGSCGEVIWVRLYSYWLHSLPLNEHGTVKARKAAVMTGWT